LLFQMFTSLPNTLAAFPILIMHSYYYWPAGYYYWKEVYQNMNVMKRLFEDDDEILYLLTYDW